LGDRPDPAPGLERLERRTLTAAAITVVVGLLFVFAGVG
jgi:hypothetical protein